MEYRKPKGGAPVSQQSVLYQWTEEIRKNMPNLSKPQAKVLAAFSVGIAKEEGCGLSAAAKKLPFVGNPATVERRIQRFIANDGIDHAESCRAMARWVIGSLPENRPVVILVDETSQKDRLKAMVAAVAFEGRSLPVAWWVYPNEKWPMGMVELIAEMLGWIRDAMDELGGGRKAIVVADRGIGNSPSLLREIESLGMFYLMRVTKKVRVMMEDGEVSPFDEMPNAPGKPWRRRAKAFKKSGWIECWAECVWDCDHAEPWFLVTNCPESEGREYGIRMWIELMFRDMKSGGWKWERSRVWRPERANRLWLAMSLAYVWMVSLGVAAFGSDRAVKEVAGGRARAARSALFQLGLDMFHLCLEMGRSVSCALLFSRVREKRAKSVV